MTNAKPAVTPAKDLPAQQGSGYPSPFEEPCADRTKWALGDGFGLTDFGVNLVTLNPGAWSAQRHWHSHEDELVYVLAGTPTLVTDAGETPLAPGMVAGFKAGRSDGHHLVNRSDEPCQYLEIGSRNVEDDCHYPDVDLHLLKGGKGGWFTRKDGTPYPRRDGDG